ncbi:MAG: hypothetical protein ABI779_15825 [Acidobacteriota bacterium]
MKRAALDSRVPFFHPSPPAGYFRRSRRQGTFTAILYSRLPGAQSIRTPIRAELLSLEEEGEG